MGNADQCGPCGAVNSVQTGHKGIENKREGICHRDMEEYADRRKQTLRDEMNAHATFGTCTFLGK